MKLEKVLCCMFLFSLLALTLHKTQYLFTPYCGTNQYKCFDYVTHAECINAKQKILHGLGPWHLCLFLLCLLGSITFPLY